MSRLHSTSPKIGLLFQNRSIGMLRIGSYRSIRSVVAKYYP